MVSLAASTFEQAVLALAERRPLLRARDLAAHGLPTMVLSRLVAAGRLERIARGVYSLPDRLPMQYQDIAEVCQRIPKAVICLLSALQFHEIGTQLPRQVWIALPEAARTPAVTYPPIRIARLRGAAYSEGIETVIHTEVRKLYPDLKPPSEEAIQAKVLLPMKMPESEMIVGVARSAEPKSALISLRRWKRS